MPDRVVVAGGTGGIGSAVVEVLLSRGVDCVAVGRNPSRVQEALTRWRHEFPERQVDALSLNLGSVEALPQLEELVAPYDRLSGLVVVAGSGAPSDGTLLERHEASQRNNVLPALLSLTVCEQRLRQNAKASVVLVSSIAGSEYIACPAEYAAAKAALHAYATHWSRSLAPVRVNVIAAGNIDSDASVWRRRKKTDFDGLQEVIKRDVALGRLGEVEEIASSVAFLLSDGSSFVNGSILRVDGGQARAW